MLSKLTSNVLPSIVTVETEDNKIIELKTSHFPDKEIYLRIMNPGVVNEASVIITSSLNSSEDLVKVIILLDDLKRNGAKNIRLVLDKEYDIKNNLDRLLRFYCDQLFCNSTVSSATPLEAIKKDEGPHLVTKVFYEHRRLEQDAKEAADYINAASERIELVKPDESPLSWKVNIKSELRGEDIILVHTTENVYDFAELWVMLIALREAGVNTISLINTYEGYSRQDKEFNPGEAVSAETMLKTLDALVDNHMALNVHYADNSGKVENKSDPNAFVNKYTLYNLNAFVQLAENLFDRIAVWSERNLAEELNKHPLVLVGPDDGALGYAEEAAELLKNYIQKKYDIDITVNVGYMDKKRISGKEVQIEGRVLGKDGNSIATVSNIRDCWVMILDDETSWGTTLLASTYALVRKAGVAWSRVLTGVVHGKLARGSEPFITGHNENDIIAAVKNGVAIEPKQEYVNETKKLMPPRLFVTTKSIVLPKDFPEDQRVSIGLIVAHAAKTFVGQKVPLHELRRPQVEAI
ncbi:MAG: ribose-phosphate pyrophosphokinase-like domain-containing protein [Candidatus Omnitrophica bacterium]|nr:ribose-phosphate pyrophosphokinase-like domain-containing protein [Candidatus Omnitrophota bacterium]